MKPHNYTETELISLASKIAKTLKGGEIIELIGDVGAGKTTFTRALIQSLGVKDEIQSPTYTISNRYQLPDTSKNIEIVHYDFYRLTEPGIIQNELTETIQNGRAVVILEWSDIVENTLPSDRLTVEITPTSELTRMLTFKVGGQNSRRLLEGTT